MKLIISGATGFVGRHLVPLLRSRGLELLLVGRDGEGLRRIFPDLPTATYDELPAKAHGFDQFLNLATANNDLDAPLETFMTVNVDTVIELLSIARAAGVTRFVNVSSTHALDESNRTPYAESKREAMRRLSQEQGIAIVSLCLAYVYDERFDERLTILKPLPAPLRRLAFAAIAALKPTTNIRAVADFVTADPERREDGHTTAIVTDGQDDNRVYGFVHRAIDLVFALVVLVALPWLLLLIWIAVRLESPGAGIFAQERVGRHGRAFTCYKFRTMKAGTANVGTHEVSAAAVTRVGAFLRKSKLDELPQVWNILRNEISLIGPRPCLPSQVELVEARRIRGVLALMPGISGLSQVNDIDMSNPERLAEMDARYGALRCLLLDLKIVVATLFGRGRGDRVVPGAADGSGRPD